MIKIAVNKEGLLPEYLSNVYFSTEQDAFNVLRAFLKSIEETTDEVIEGRVVVDDKPRRTYSINDEKEYAVRVRIGGWAEQIVKALNEEEAKKIAIATPSKWGYSDYYWWYDKDGGGGYEEVEGVYPPELQIIDVEEVL